MKIKNLSAISADDKVRRGFLTRSPAYSLNSALRRRNVIIAKNRIRRCSLTLVFFFFLSIFSLFPRFLIKYGARRFRLRRACGHVTHISRDRSVLPSHGRQTADHTSKA